MAVRESLPDRALAKLGAFFRMEALAGLALVAAGMGALLVANSSFGADYSLWLEHPWRLGTGALSLTKTSLHWINDGLMALFFLVVGLELKREIVEGQFADRSQIALPVACAAGGMLVPMAVYAFFNFGDPQAMRGMAIPAATDIAFALGVLALLGPRVPLVLKMLLMAIAVADDLGAIMLIALFYTSQLSWLALGVAALALAGLVALNRMACGRLGPYLLLGGLLWLAVLKSGVHATLAGVVLGLSIPMSGGEAGRERPLEALLHALHPWVAFAILPLFAFANAGVPLVGLVASDLFRPVPLGIAAGLLLGKQAGVFFTAWLVVKLGFVRRPEGLPWPALYGVSVLCGIGFTMSLFIGSLAFESTQAELLSSHRLGILGGSLLSAVIGFGVLWKVLPMPAKP